MAPSFPFASPPPIPAPTASAYPFNRVKPAADFVPGTNLDPAKARPTVPERRGSTGHLSSTLPRGVGDLLSSPGGSPSYSHRPSRATAGAGGGAGAGMGDHRSDRSSLTLVPTSAPHWASVAMEDVEDVSFEADEMTTPSSPLASHLGRLTVGQVSAPLPSAALTHLGAIPLSPLDGRRLSEYLFGDVHHNVPSAWLQGIFFGGPIPAVCLVQQQGGPCGVIATIQALLFAQIIHTERLRHTDGRVASFNPHLVDPAVAHEALIEVLADVCWRARPNVKAPARVVSGCDAPLPPERQSSGTEWAEWLHTAKLVKCVTKRATVEAWRTLLPQVMLERGYGVLQVVVSVVLSRGWPALTLDGEGGLDRPSMCTQHAYCAQELVNLILTGRATGLCFDGERDLDGLTLRGVAPGSSKVGLLMLVEWYGSSEVGPTYKDPQIPVWVIFSESHYSVLVEDGVPYGQYGDRQVVSQSR